MFDNQIEWTPEMCVLDAKSVVWLASLFSYGRQQILSGHDTFAFEIPLKGVSGEEKLVQVDLFATTPPERLGCTGVWLADRQTIQVFGVRERSVWTGLRTLAHEGTHAIDPEANDFSEIAAQIEEWADEERPIEVRARGAEMGFSALWTGEIPEAFDLNEDCAFSRNIAKLCKREWAGAKATLDKVLAEGGVVL